MEAAKLIRYVHASRRRYLQTLKELHWEEVVKDRGASFSSIRDILLHALNIEDRMINYIATGKVQEWVQGDVGNFVDFSSIEKRVNEVEGKVDAYLKKLSERELARDVVVPRRRGPPSTMTVEDLLVQVAIENIAHMGEFIAILWRIDERPPFMSWSNFLEEGT
ncbi:unnamed protein product [marine sediment metagenome]|uniref:DinB-like domain-containing protein n=1 Tax=marine sediment metagenome TaxID=412755 RepID=X1C6M9_9ZZZZ